MIISSSNGFKCVIQTQQYWQLLIWTYIEKGPNWIPQNAICCNNVMLLNITYPQTCYLMLESWKQTQFYPGLVAQQSLLYKNVHVLLISRLFWSWTTENKRFSSKKKHKNTLASFHGCSMASLMKNPPPKPAPTFTATRSKSSGASVFSWSAQTPDLMGTSFGRWSWWNLWINDGLMMS